MNRRRTLGLLALLPLLAAADKCTGSDPNDKTGDAGAQSAAPEPFQLSRDPGGSLRGAALSAWVEPEFGEYRVQATAKDLDTGDQTTLTDDPTDKTGATGQRVSAGQQWRYTLAYPEHHRVEINIHVKAAKSGSSHGYIAVRTIDRRPGRKTVTFAGTAAASLYTVCE